MDLKRRLILSTIFSVIKLGFSRIVGFIVTPYILVRLGADRFSLWAIAGGLLGFVSKMDLGVATSYAKFISQFYAKKDYENINKVVNSGFIYYIGISVSIYLAYFLVGDRFFQWYLHEYEAVVVADVKMLVRYLLLFNMISWSFNVFSAVLWGIQRADVVQKVQTVLLIANAACVFLFLELGYNLRGLVWAEGVTLFLGVTMYILLAYKFIPALQFNPFLCDSAMFRKMFSYGLHLQFSRIAKIAQMQLSKMFLPRFLPLSTITVYEIGSRISLSIRSLPLSLSPAIVPAASQLYALEDSKIVDRLYYRASKYMTLSVTYLLGFGFCMMPNIILSWTGEQLDVSSVSTIARILLVGHAYYLLSDITSVVVLGKGHPEYLARASVVKLVLLTGLNFLLIPSIGVVAAALATAISEIVGTLYFALGAQKELHQPYTRVITHIYLKPIAAWGIACFLTGGFVKSVYWAGCEPQGRLENIGLVMIGGLLFTVVYGLTLLKSHYIDTYDRDLLLQLLKKLRRT